MCVQRLPLYSNCFWCHWIFHTQHRSNQQAPKTLHWLCSMTTRLLWPYSVCAWTWKRGGPCLPSTVTSLQSGMRVSNPSSSTMAATADGLRPVAMCLFRIRSPKDPRCIVYGRSLNGRLLVRLFYCSTVAVASYIRNFLFLGGVATYDPIICQVCSHPIKSLLP